MSNLDELKYWIAERWNVYHLKQQHQPKPWSDNKVFQETYFCNVHRENDKVTKWIRGHYNIDLDLMPEFNMILARFVNKPSSLDQMGWPFDKWGIPQQARFELWMGQPGAWGSAYIVSTNGRSMPKHEYISGLLTAALEQCEQVGKANTCLAAHVALQRISGLASFMAAQVVADLKNTKGHPLNTAEDWWTFVAPGPGSLRGMAWVLEWEKCSPKEFMDGMVWLRHEIDEWLPESIPKFCNQDLQNCLCEFDKFMRVTKGTGKSKRKYAGA